MTGRPSTYTEEVGREICEHLANGHSLRSWCAQDGKPNYSTIMDWLRRHPDFTANYTRAREDAAHNDAEQIAEVRQMVRDGELEPDAARVVIDSLKWTAGRRLPKVYGDRVQHSGDADGAPIIVSWGKPED